MKNKPLQAQVQAIETRRKQVTAIAQQVDDIADLDKALATIRIDERVRSVDMPKIEIKSVPAPLELPKEFILRDEMRARAPLMVAKLMDIIASGINRDAIKAIELGLAYAYGRPEHNSLSIQATANLSPAELIKTIESRTRKAKPDAPGPEPIDV